MPRAARLVVPGLPHHVVQRGNRQAQIFFNDDDRRCYIDLLTRYCVDAGTQCLAWCLMDNHVHLVLVPADEDGLRAPLARLHTVYSQRVNRRDCASGHLFQGRFRSYPMDDAHLMVAVRYIENNPVAAGLVERAEDWPWSSARAHIAGDDDGLTNVAQLSRHIANWRAMLAQGLEAADMTAVELALAAGKVGEAPRPRGRPFKRHPG